MHFPPATRQERQLFSFIFPLQLLRWTSYACPHCHHVFRRDFWPYNVRLGSGERQCRWCSKVFDDGSREWPELSLAKKLRFFFPPLLLGICGGFEVAPILAFFLTPHDEHSGPLVIVFSALIIGVLALVWFPLRMIWVLRSNNRHNRELRVSRP